jgi:hypothetical protein
LEFMSPDPLALQETPPTNEDGGANEVEAPRVFYPYDPTRP